MAYLRACGRRNWAGEGHREKIRGAMAVETVTLMFTDLVGSTELLSRLGEEDAELLRRDHFALLRDALVTHNGREVKNVGDGLMIAFESVSGALACAVTMQQSIERRNRAAVVPLAVRIGISHGDCDVEDGDYFGVPVVEAARLCARAGGDEILITDVVRWIAGSRGRFAFEPLGALELKGLDGAVVVHKVAWDPLPAGAGSVDVPLPGAIAARANAVFVGRVSERAVLADSLKQAVAARRRRIVLLEGEAGIGKTTLVSSFARDAHADGAIVLYGRCDEDLSVPYQPWAEALDHLTRHLPESIVRAHVDARGADLSALVPALAARHDLPPRRSTDPETERHLLFGAVVDLLERATTEQPLVLVLDDLHWVDRPSLQLLRHVIAAPSEMQLLLLATFRGTDVGAGHPLADARAALHREEGVERVALRGLDDLELLALMEASAGHSMDASEMALRDELLAETDGNPFFAIEILRHLVETGAITESGGHWVAQVDPRTHGLPVSVREVIGRRVERLGVDATPALAAAAVVGREFELALVAGATDLAEAVLLDVIDSAVAAHIISEVPGAPDRFVFVHALIQHTLYDDLSAARRRRLHRRVAEALEAMPGDPDDRVGRSRRGTGMHRSPTASTRRTHTRSPPASVRRSVLRRPRPRVGSRKPSSSSIGSNASPTVRGAMFSCDSEPRNDWQATRRFEKRCSMPAARHARSATSIALPRRRLRIHEDFRARSVRSTATA